MKTDLEIYYDRRAAEYEAIYHKPERQADLLEATTLLQSIFKNRQVLEIACGTGYWTQRIAEVAHSVHAIDVNKSVIEIARNKHYSRQNLLFEVGDLYEIPPLQCAEALFGGFIWSHISKQNLANFIGQCNRLVKAGGNIVFMDNRYVPGSGTPISRRDEHGNTYQTRHLQNGEAYSILKNFPEKTELEETLRPNANQLSITETEFFWICQYEPKQE